MKSPVPKPCRDCIYRSMDTSTDFACNYASVEGRTRLGQGARSYPGGGCSLKKIIRVETIKPAPVPPAKLEWEPRRLSQEVHDKRMTLYLAGESDGVIARATGVRSASIQHWRRQHGLPANYRPGGKKIIKEEPK